MSAKTSAVDLHGDTARSLDVAAVIMDEVYLDSSSGARRPTDPISLGRRT
jgi:hypothetical protein